MPYRTLPLVNGEYYHIYNRGVAHLPTYSSKKDYERFMLCLSYYRFNNLPFKLSHLLQISQEERENVSLELESIGDLSVEIIAFCLMPNHFHLLIQQKTDGGISNFMRLLTNSYTRYYNTKYVRVGSLFQGVFKAVRIETTEQLMHISRYIHLNPLVSFVIREEEFFDYRWSSLKHYLNIESYFVNSTIVMSNFKSVEDYREFVLNQADYGKELERIKHLTLEKYP